MQILPTVAASFSSYSGLTDNPDYLPILLSISVFYFLVFLFPLFYFLVPCGRLRLLFTLFYFYYIFSFSLLGAIVSALRALSHPQTVVSCTVYTLHLYFELLGKKVKLTHVGF